MKLEKLTFVFVGLLLFILGFDILMIVHYIKNLSGMSLIAIGSILAGTFLAVMAAWFCLKPNATTSLKLVAFTCKVALILVGGLSATSIITLYFHEKEEAAARQVQAVKDATRTEAEIARIEAEKKAKLAETDAQIKQIEALKQAAMELRKTAGTAAAKELIRATSVVPLETPTPAPEQRPALLASVQADHEQQAKEAESHTFKAWLLEYVRGGVYYVPTIANILVFIGLGAFLTFGKAYVVAETSQGK